jgi:hypothetical protein
MTVTMLNSILCIRIKNVFLWFQNIVSDITQFLSDNIF